MRAKRAITLGCGLPLLAVMAGCGHRPVTIAAISLVASEPTWLQEHAGVLRAAAQQGVRIYWNAPDREEDVQRQITLVEQVRRAGDAGLILAPEQELALTLPVKQVLASGMPVVVVHAPLALLPGHGLAYVVNDEEAMGRTAAQIISHALGGHGRVAISGVQPLHPAVMRRMQAFEEELTRDAPGMTVAAPVPATRDDFAAEESLQPLFRGPQGVDAVFAMDTAAGIGAEHAVQGLQARPVIVACGQDALLLQGVRAGVLKAVLAEDSQTMGYLAVQAILQMLRHAAVPPLRRIPPIVVTQATLGDPAVQDRVVNLPVEPL